MNSEKREQLTSVGTGAQTTARTAGPWYAKQSCTQMSSQDTTVAHCNGDWWIFADAEDHGDPESTAAFIVRACNAHDDLVAALRRAEAYIHMRDECTPQAQSNIQQSIAALAKAGAL